MLIEEIMNKDVSILRPSDTLSQDLTELESVKKLQETLSTILEITYNGIIVIDEQGLVTHANHSFLEFSMHTLNELQGRHIHQIFPKCRLPIIAKTGVPETSEILYIQNTPFVVSGLPIIKEGLVVGAVGVIHFANNRETLELVNRLASLQKKVEYYRGELQKSKVSKLDFDNIITKNKQMASIKEEARRFSNSSSTVLIMGESGTGKELFAQAIHFNSSRWKKPIIMLNCAAIPENLLESELFGYAPGAFTGAGSKGKPGRFELANEGTLFLDEIGDMSLVLQAKILRAIETCQFERVGGIEPIKVDVRIIAATNKNLEKAVADGQFRGDLYYRINVMELWLPPLRERREDIELLCDFFIKRFNEMFGTKISGLSYEARVMLLNYRWPGNIRELENCIERGVQIAREGSLGVEHLPMHITRCSIRYDTSDAEKYHDKKDCADRQIILEALQKNGGNRLKAAKFLGVSRSTLYEKMKKLEVVY